MASRAPVVHLIDGPVYVFRAYHSLPPMRAPDGTPTNAAYGYANTLLKYLAQVEATHAAVAFDFSDQSFRNAIEPGYKAQRGETPPDLAPQFDLCMELTRALGLEVYVLPDFEADDLIATLAERLLAQRASAVIVTTDKDLAQLVREDGRVNLYDLARDELRDADAVRARFGVDPEQIPDYLGLVGDAVDNLPGVPGVGPKSAAAALRRFGSIEGIPADAAAWSDAGVRGAASVAARIEAHRERALLTRSLATLRRDVPGIASELSGLVWRGADRAAIEPLFARLGWGKIATRIPRWA
ncbi:MAG TPA: 5'-3' exonuclease H3TH domain-containing protein [Myxococcota bacterium]|jgi:5'-3' exonuclease